ncbi:MAG: tRNA (N6-isopentenyl adenosine(37)-C2)-methylthiotransferase MiaB [Gammaproteobacteria bacterium]|nr:tRNA (N6-isopentenyl adenosine(37)-C2)-methylthiotransferase MiaB [Gammaproteobacteria bacterium]MDE0415204.1 tRNA (N6-isopentenyl adenosine(37)-C2)-methylthiotransferase MiaB [Gammaproteobacteria bacterium]MDE0454838.1 tRNA (N6-isopentenyl adenosine(37)-C2)-methylthiotransferase MiaB [Gammaproteobacteria bacterium]
MSGKLFIRTFGCQMNEYDSARMADVLRESRGYTLTENPEEADLVLINTCSVREKPQEKLFSELGRYKALKRKRPEMKIGVGGCVASQEGEAIGKRAPYVDIIFGPQTLHRLPGLLQQSAAASTPVVDIAFPAEEKFEELPAPKTASPVAHLSIMEGCSKYCSFCVVPYTRGEEISRPVADVLAEAIQLERQGVREINLLGQNVNGYRGVAPSGGLEDLAGLIRYVSKLKGIGRIRFTTSHPMEFDGRLIDAYARFDKLPSYLHLPVQSGSDSVLARMKRGYTADEYRDKIARLRRARAGISVASDFIVGFPGETEEEFADTLALVEDIGFDQSFSFMYSPRPGTPAERMEEQVPHDVKLGRLQRLQALITGQARRISAQMVNTSQRILVERPARRGEGLLAGRTGNNRWVNFDGPPSLIGRFVDVAITEALPNSLRGRLLPESLAA